MQDARRERIRFRRALWFTGSVVGVAVGSASAQCLDDFITNPQPIANDAFGQAVALGGNRMAVSERANTNPSIVRVYEREEGVNGGTWALVQSLSTVGGNFSVTRRGLAFDGDDLVVGEPGAGPSTGGTGQVTVYRETREGWSPVQTILPPTPTGFQRFGQSVSVSGDWLVIGAPYQTTSGAAYVYQRTESGWELTQELLGLGGSTDNFGSSVAASGAWIAIGAPNDDDFGFNAGAIHVYRFVRGAWTPHQVLGQADVWRLGLGVTLGMSDGSIIGGTTMGTGGQTWRYDAQSDQWLGDATLGFLVMSPLFATSVAIDGERAVVASATDVRAYERTDDGWRHAMTLDSALLWPTNSGLDYAPELSLDGDTLLAGVPTDDTGASNAGAVALYPLSGPDADGDGVFDACDNCELPNSGQEDCDGDGIGDACAIEMGLVADCDGNGVADECDPDCDGDGVPNACAIASGAATDCDGNGVPDSCDIASADCNGNGVPDACDIASGAADDCDGNLIPDSCDGGLDTPYAYDDGEPEMSYGFADGQTPIVWMNAFEVEPGYTTITAISVNWGPSTTGTGTVVLWSDPNQDGDPSDAQTIMTLPGVPIGAPAWTSVIVPVPPTSVGPAGTIFFVGAQASANGWATFDTDGPFAGQSWFTSATNLNDLDATYTPTQPGVVLPPANFMVRAIATADDADGNGVPDVCESPGDLDGDGEVGARDLAILLGAWGLCPAEGTCGADLDGDGAVGPADLAILLGLWG